jgi:hypothetical protein
VTHGLRVHATDPAEQLVEVVGRLQLEGELAPLTRCAVCNTPVQPVAREAVRDQVPPPVLARQHRFCRCPSCRRLYWEGGHIRRWRARLAARLAAPPVTE